MGCSLLSAINATMALFKLMDSVSVNVPPVILVLLNHVTNATQHVSLVLKLQIPAQDAARVLFTSRATRCA